MKTNTYFILYLAIILCCNLVLCKDLEFYLGEFEITVPKHVLLNDMQIGKQYRFFTENYKMDSRLSDKQQIREWNNAIINLLNGKTFNWHGTTQITNIELPLNLEGVRLGLNSSGLNIYAIEGTANIDRDRFPQSEFFYNIDNCEVLLSTASVVLNSEFAQGTCFIHVRKNLFASKDEISLRLLDIDAILHPDGSISEEDFNLTTDYRLNFSEYELRIESSHVKVKIGEVYADSETDRGIQFYCFTSLGSLLLEGIATLKPHRYYSRYEFMTRPGTIIGPLEPECGYKLNIDSINQVFEYEVDIFSTNQSVRPSGHLIQQNRVPIKNEHVERTDTPARSELSRSNLQNRQQIKITDLKPVPFKEKLKLINYEGHVFADLIIPGAVTDMDGNQIYLIDLNLKIDQSGNIYGKTELPRIKINDAFSAKVSGDNAWIYFDNWNGGEEHFVCIDNNIDKRVNICEEYTFPELQRAGYLKRCGVTLLNGEFYWIAPQADADYLHCKFWGGLTITPMGIAGALTSANHLVVSEIEESVSISNFEKTFKYPDLLEIIENGNNVPVDPSHLFKLSGVKIQKMIIDSILFCENRIYRSRINYTAHFPYPSFFNSDFTDKTLTNDGRFHKAVGPTSSEYGYYVDSPDSLPSYNKTGKILWFWRLPFTLYRNTIFINHQSETDNSCIISIENADLGIMPLTSRDDDHKEGVIFNASITSDGNFTITGFEQENFFGKYNNEDFECNLNSITLVDLGSLPADRETDLMWTGNIKFPLFKETDISFKVRNIVPSLTETISKLSYGVRLGTREDTLYIDLKNMDYSYDKSLFFRDAARYRKTLETEDYISGRLEIYSYINALLTRGGTNRRTEPLVLSEADADYSELCDDNNKITIEQITDWISSEDIFDLVCYDPEANDARNRSLEAGMPDLCSTDLYYSGNYQIITQNEDDPSTSTVVLNIPNARVFLEPLKRIYADNSDMIFSSEINHGETPININVPGLQIYYQDGEFSGKMNLNTNLAPGLPVESRTDLEIFLNPHCNYFYIWGGVDFDFYIAFDAHLLIAHSPFSKIEHLSNRLAGYANISEGVFQKNAFPDCNDGSELENCMFSSMVVSGGFGIPLAIFRVNLGAGFWYTTNVSGTILGGYNTASAELDLYVIAIEVGGTLSGYWSPEDNDILLTGSMFGSGCISAFIGHCSGTARFTADFSDRGGFNAQFDKVESGCDWGGCD